MSNFQEEYKCSKCGNTLLKSNQLLHDLKCVGAPIKNSIVDNLNNYDFIIDNETNLWDCEICGITLKLKDKADHLLCHEMEKEEENRINNINNNDFTFNNNDSLNRLNNINNNNPRRNVNNILNFHELLNNRNNNNRNYNNRLRNNIDSDDSNNNDRNSDLDLDSIDSLDDFDDIDGIDDDIINQYPTSKIKDISKLTEDKKRCSICLENFKNGDNSIILPCIHIFHGECIKKWMNKKNACPICKSKINNNEINSEY